MVLNKAGLMRHGREQARRIGRRGGLHGPRVDGRPGACLYIEDLDSGDEFEVVAIHGGYMAQSRLSELGLAVGVRATVEKGFPLIISVGDTRLALGRGLARKVEVRRTDDGKG